MNKSVFEIKKSADKQFYFVLKAGNGEVIGTSETYKAKQSCFVGIDSVVINSEIQEKFVRKTAENGGHFFVLKSKNGRTILVSEIYTTEAGVTTGITSVVANAASAEVVDLTKRVKNGH